MICKQKERLKTTDTPAIARVGRSRTAQERRRRCTESKHRIRPATNVARPEIKEKLSQFDVSSMLTQILIANLLSAHTSPQLLAR